MNDRISLRATSIVSDKIIGQVNDNYPCASALTKTDSEQTTTNFFLSFSARLLMRCITLIPQMKFQVVAPAHQKQAFCCTKETPTEISA